MGKKLSRSKRRELREQGLLEPISRADLDAKKAERRAEEEAASGQVPVVTRAEDDPADGEAEEAPRKGPPTRDRTLLVLVAVTALAALIFWLTQRSPTKETKIDVPPPPAAPTGTAKP